MGEAQAKQYDPDNKLLAPPEWKPVRYTAQFLEMVCQYEDNGGQPVLNPRDVGEQSLYNADSVFMREKALWRMWKRYYFDHAPKPK